MGRLLICVVCQVLWTWPVLLAIYMCLAVTDYQGGIDGFIGLVVVQPILGTLLAAATMFACLLAGLPIRLHQRLRAWWSRHPSISLTGIALALLSFVAANVPRWKQSALVWVDAEPTEITTLIPNMHLLGVAWFLAAFFLLHLFPPFLRSVKNGNLTRSELGKE